MTHLVRFWTAVAERGHDVGLDLEPDRAHPERVLDALLAVDDVAARGRTWRTSRFDGIETARATSVARLTSSRATSRPWPLTATAPREFWLSTCCPPTPDEGAVDLVAGQALGLLDRARRSTGRSGRC